MQRQIEWLLKEKYKGKKTKAFRNDIEKLEKGEPVDYLIGFVYFLGAKIDLRFKPLIPRPETEYFLLNHIKEIKGKVLDIFSGSGCIGIALLKEKNNVFVNFADIDNSFLKQIKINLKINDIKGGFRIIKSDVFSKIQGKYDYIIANPPYIAEKRISKVQDSVLKYEPKHALLAGKDGLLYINKFLKQARRYLNKKGKIFLEFDSFQKKEIEKILKKEKYLNYYFEKDQYNKVRYLIYESSI